MLGPVIVFAIVYAIIISEKIDKTILALIGATIVLALHYVGYEEALHAIDLNVIFLLIGMMVIVAVLADTGVFEWLAITVARIAKGNGMVIIMSFMVLTAVLSAFLDNVTTVILIAPITILISQILELPTKPILIMEVIFSNIGGTATMIGDPPNIIIGSQTTLTFNDFLFNMAPVVVIIMIATMIVLWFMWHRKFKTSEEAKIRIKHSRPQFAIIQMKKLKLALPIFVLVLIGFFFGGHIDLEPGIVALGGAMLMLAVTRVSLEHVTSRVEWGTILFFVGLFMLISSLEHNGVFEWAGLHLFDLCGGDLWLTVLGILWFSALASVVVDNIPLVIAMIPLVKTIVPIFAQQMGLETSPEMTHTLIEAPLFWALALGACLGGNGSLIGASANVVVAQMANRNGMPISFMGFTKYGFPFMLLSLLICTGYIYIRYFYLRGM